MDITVVKLMKILFVCYGNAFRSPLAEALLKKLRPDLEVDSAGLHVAIPVSGEVKAFLSKRNAVSYLKETPQSIDEKELRRYDLIVVMEQVQANAVLRACPECKARIVAWNVEDPYFLARDDADNVFLQIENKVKELAKSL
jgi:protein-tyrosine-phosphatase